jgi:hypothetical protein
MHQAGRRLGSSCDWTSSQIRNGSIGNLTGYPIPACHVGSRSFSVQRQQNMSKILPISGWKYKPKVGCPETLSLFSGLGTRDQKILTLFARAVRELAKPPSFKIIASRSSLPPTVMASLTSNTSPQLSPKVSRSWYLTTRHISLEAGGFPRNAQSGMPLVHAEVHRYLTRSQHVLYKYLLGVACRAWSCSCCTMLQMSECRRIVHCAASLSSTGEKHCVYSCRGRKPFFNLHGPWSSTEIFFFPGITRISHRNGSRNLDEEGIPRKSVAQ